MSRRPRPRFGGKCAVCYVDPVTGRVGTNETTQLCPDCKKDPMNKGWRESWEDSDEGIAARAAGTGLAAVQEKPLRDTSELEARIKDLATRGAYRRVPVRDRQGRRRGYRMRYVALSFRAIARELGCSDMHVRRVVKGQLK